MKIIFTLCTILAFFGSPLLSAFPINQEYNATKLEKGNFLLEGLNDRYNDIISQEYSPTKLPENEGNFSLKSRHNVTNVSKTLFLSSTINEEELVKTTTLQQIIMYIMKRPQINLDFIYLIGVTLLFLL